ncbi:MAG: hypothetical protein U0842_26255 [Candidatus Binatia bacterium]
MFHANALALVACNAADVYSQVSTCTSSSDPCIITEPIRCTGTCSNQCSYDFGTKVLSLKGANARFEWGNPGGGAADISITAGSVQNFFANESGIVRFDAGGGDLSVTATTGTVNIASNIIQSIDGTATVAATNTSLGKSINGNCTFGTIDVHSTVTGAPGGTVSIGCREVIVNDKIDVRSNGGGNAGSVTILTTDVGTPPSTSASVVAFLSADLLASVSTTASTADGGSVYIGPVAGATFRPFVEVHSGSTIDVGAKNGGAGSIAIDADTFDLDASSSISADANATSGTHGGSIEISATSATYTYPVWIRGPVSSRAATGGFVKIRFGGYGAIFDDTINVASNQGPAGTGGAISIRSVAQAGATSGCWDCQEPGDPCVCAEPFNGDCNQVISIGKDLLAHGYGSQGIGGTITLEAPRVTMANTGTTVRRMTTNATSGVDSSSGTAGGRIRIRARDSLFVAKTTSGTNHKIRSLPSAGNGEICTTQPDGGSFNPSLPVAGCLSIPSYAPTCNPG